VTDPTIMFGLVEALARKPHLNGEPEYMAYQKGLAFAEKYFALNAAIIEEEIKKLREKNGEVDYPDPIGGRRPA
jgi:hypothetical protein